MDIEKVWKNIPPFTKYYIIGCIFLALTTTFGLLGLNSIYLDFELVCYRL